LLFDGRKPPLANRADHFVRVISSPGERDQPILGVALDDDSVVFTTRDFVVSKVRLDGLSLWHAQPSQPKELKNDHAGLPRLGELNGDGVLDVIVPIENAELPSRRIRALDGRTGAQLSDVATLESADNCRSADVLHSVDNGDRVLLGRCGGLGTWGLIEYLGRFEEQPVDGEIVLLTPPKPQVILDGLDASYSDLELPVSIGDFDADGIWDAALVEHGYLRVFSTGLSNDAQLRLWRGDNAATGAAPALDYPAAYNARLAPRDKRRWLKADRDPADSAFEFVDYVPAEFTGSSAVPEPSLPQLSSEPAFIDQTTCGETQYALNEGELVARVGDAWQLVPGAPAPLVMIRCSADGLLLRTASATNYRLNRPMPWQPYVWLSAVFVALLCAYAVWFFTRATPAHATTARIQFARRAVIHDGPRTQRVDAHPNQSRLLNGLLNVLDNDDTRPPLTLALYGAWGSGKSSLMQMLRSELKQTGRYIDVWFNAWRFQREPELAPALLQSIVDEVGRQTDWVTRVALLWHRMRTASVRDIAWFLFPAGLLGVVVAVCLKWLSGAAGTGNVGGRLGTLASLVWLLVSGGNKVWEPLTKVFSLDPAKRLSSDDSKQRIQFVREFSSEFERIASRLPRGTRLCIFIDDLDRCAPARIVDVLETLSMLADTGCGFFVLAIDPTTIRRAIELQYKELLLLTERENPQEVRSFGTRYLEKMITLGVHVPMLRAEEIEPDLRLEAPAKTSLWTWLHKRVLPEPPLFVALVLLLAGTVWVLNHGRSVSEFFGELARVALNPDFGLSKDKESETAKADKQKQTPHPQNPATETAAPAHQKTKTDDTLASKTPATTSASPATQPRVSYVPEPSGPAVIEVRAAEAPSSAIRLGVILANGSMIAAALATLIVVTLVYSDWRRRRRIAASRPLGSDSPAFSAALKQSKQLLPSNPRGVVRFTNASRFLYQVIAESDACPSEPAWAVEFFTAMSARWLGAESSSVSPWLLRELDSWMPLNQPDRGSDRPRGAS
jgi:Cdc6-like AAA superfamily ATPase